MRKDLDDNELIKMQQEAIRRVQEMQKKARLTFEESQLKAPPLNHPPQHPQDDHTQAKNFPPLPVADGSTLHMIAGLLLEGKRDPILAAALAYLGA